MEERVSKPVWFLFLEELTTYMKEKHVSKETQTAVIQEIKRISLKELNLYGNTLNLRERHIPQVQAISKKVLEKFPQMNCSLEAVTRGQGNGEGSVRS